MKLKLIALTIVLCLLSAAAAVYVSGHVWAAGQFISRDVMELDLTKYKVSVKDYEKLSQELPGCDISWEVPFRGKYYSQDTKEIAVKDLTMSDVKVLKYLPELTHLDAGNSRNYEALTAFLEDHPYCRVDCYVTLKGKELPSDTASVSVDSPDLEELKAMLPLMSRLEKMEFTGTLPDSADLQQLAASYDQVKFQWPVKLDGQTLPSTQTSLDLSGRFLTEKEARELLLSFPYLESAEMHDCGLTAGEMMGLVQDFPNCAIGWDITIGNVTLSTDAEEIDISGQVLASPEEIEELLPCFPNVKKVVMSDCGLDDETMDALNQRHEDVRFVWSVMIGPDKVRTDAKFYYPFVFAHNRVVNNEQLKPLKYCTDMEAIDIGHMTTVTDCSWVANMPNLKYLIIVETAITDISPLANLKNLVFLEIFTTNITDYSPLLECTALEDLNLGKTYGDPAPIAQMKWLKNVWWSGVDGTYGKPCSNAKAVLTEALPGTELRFNLSTPNVNNGWRSLQNYKDMRGLMGVFCLN